MHNTFDNPFSVTRAADFTDEQIFQYWVDLADNGGFLDLIQPRLEMPMIIFGGKGSGKTHLMRYLSFPLQKMRHSGNLSSGVQGEGYLGIYMRCSGLNSTRFRGKQQTDDTWADVFAYYMELWLAQMAVDVSCDVIEYSSESHTGGSAVLHTIRDLFDDPLDDFPGSLGALSEMLRALQRELDLAINNCVLDGQLHVTIRASSGRLIFGIPQALVAHYPQLQGITFVYLIDEFENLTEAQQKRINTLLREKQNPCSFKIGARLYGMRTYSTYCADEENKAGSEYEPLPLDSRLRDNEKRYATFAGRLVVRRLATRGMLVSPVDNDDEIESYLSQAFEQDSTEGLAEEATRFVVQKYPHRDRPHLKSLRASLLNGIRVASAPGVSSPEDVGAVIQRVACREYPLLEKLNCFILYQQWSSRRDLLEMADAIRDDCARYVLTRDTTSPYHGKLLHWKYDLLAQLRRECDQKQSYAGFDTFVELSWGNPRHLLIILKHVLAWATFRGEEPFRGEAISIKAQTEGVKEASDWFLRDAKMTGKDGQLVQDAISRLGTLFRSIRYSDKPSECSVSTFSYEPASVSDETRRLIDLAERWLLLINVGDQRDRNSERVDAKLQLNRMLAPKWDISFSRRGAIAMSGDELNAIFDPAYSADFERRLKARIDRMTAPLFGSRETADDADDRQGRLFKPDDD